VGGSADNGPGLKRVIPVPQCNGTRRVGGGGYEGGRFNPVLSAMTRKKQGARGIESGLRAKDEVERKIMEQEEEELIIQSIIHKNVGK